MLTEIQTRAIAVGILLLVIILFACLSKTFSDGSSTPSKAYRKAAKSIKNLDLEIRVLNDCCLDAINHDTSRVRWNLLMAKARNHRAKTALENDDLSCCLSWLSKAQWAVQIANLRFHNAPACRFAGHREVTINYLNNNW